MYDMSYIASLSKLSALSDSERRAYFVLMLQGKAQTRLKIIGFLYRLWVQIVRCSTKRLVELFDQGFVEIEGMASAGAALTCFCWCWCLRGHRLRLLWFGFTLATLQALA